MYALGLSDRFNEIKKEKEKFQEQNLKIVQGQNIMLEEKVQEKTKDLQEAYNQVQVANEELLQSQEEVSAQRDTLEKQNLALNRYNTRIGKSFQAAKLIQNAILKSSAEFQNFFSEHFIIYMPKGIVSGDFYWVNQIGKKLVVVAADCTGHGIPGAFMTIIGHNLLDKIVKTEQILHPPTLLDRLHEEVQLMLLNDGKQNTDAGLDAAVVIIEPQAEDFSITFTGAKRNLLYYDSPQQLWTELKGTRKSIGGVQPESIQFEEHKIILPAQSLIYFGSDGLEDQNNHKRKKFGSKRLMKLLGEIVDKPLIEQRNIIQSTIKTYMGDADQRDDILWMGLKL